MRNHLHLTHFKRKSVYDLWIALLFYHLFQRLKLYVLNPLKILKDLLEVSSYHNSNHKNIHFQPRSLWKHARKFYWRILLLLACLLKKFYGSGHNHNDYIANAHFLNPCPKSHTEESPMKSKTQRPAKKTKGQERSKERSVRERDLQYNTNLL